MTKRISVNNATHTDQAKVAVDANAVEAALAAAHAVTPAHVDAEVHAGNAPVADADVAAKAVADSAQARSEEHTSELQSLMRISYAVFCLKNKNQPHITNTPSN